MKGMEGSTDLETALDQVEGHDGRVRNTTAQDAPEPADGVVFPWAELAAITWLCDVREHTHTCSCITTRHLTCWWGVALGSAHTDTLRWLRLTHTHGPAIGTWPGRGAPQPCVWCHSWGFLRSHRGGSISVSRTHSCLPLRRNTESRSSTHSLRCLLVG